MLVICLPTMAQAQDGENALPTDSIQADQGQAEPSDDAIAIESLNDTTGESDGSTTTSEPSFEAVDESPGEVTGNDDNALEESAGDTGDETGAADTATLEAIDGPQTNPVISSGAAVPESAEAAGDSIENQAEEQSPDYEEQVTQVFSRYKEQMETGQYDEAEVTAKRQVEITLRNRGPRHKDTAAALTNLAIVQYRLEQYELAALNFETAIGDIEVAEDRLYLGLVNPLKGLGATYVKLGNADKAIVTLDRAIHISRVNEGPQNLDQVEMLDSLTEIFLSMGDLKQADEIQTQAYNLQARQTDPQSEAIIPALFRLADWQLRTRRIQQLKSTYLQIIRIIEEHRGETDMSLVKPLTGLGKAYLYDDPSSLPVASGSMSSYGEVYMKRALDIVLADPDVSWRKVARAYLELGDYYTVSGKQSRARKGYREAWDILSIDDSRLAMRARELEIPRLQRITQIPDRLDGNTAAKSKPADQTFKRGHIIVGFDVSYRGLVIDPKIIEAEPAGIEEMEKIVLRAMRQNVYRPRFENGEAVRTVQQTYRHDFYYRDKDLPKKPADPEQPEAAE